MRDSFRNLVRLLQPEHESAWAFFLKPIPTFPIVKERKLYILFKFYDHLLVLSHARLCEER